MARKSKTGEPPSHREVVQGNSTSETQPAASSTEMLQGAYQQGDHDSSDERGSVSVDSMHVTGEFNSGSAYRRDATSATNSHAATIQGTFRATLVSRITSAANDDEITIQGSIRAEQPDSARPAARSDIDIIQGAFRGGGRSDE